MPTLKIAGHHFEADALLFDKDGTILPFDPLWTSWMAALHAHLREALGDEAAREGVLWRSSAAGAHGAELRVATMAASLELLGEELIARGVHARTARRVADAAFAAADRAMEECEVVAHEGFINLVERCASAGIAMAIVTGDDGERARRQLQELGVSDHFGVVIGVDSGVPGKPDPSPVLLGCSLLDVDPARCVYIGDSLVDVRAARGSRAAGAIVYAVHGRAEWMAEADAIIEGFDEVEVVQIASVHR